MESQNLSFLDPFLHQILLNLFTKYKFPSLSFGLFYGESVRFFSFGSFDILNLQTPPTMETLFRSASITKAFTCIMMLQLRDQGLLSLDDPIRKFLSGIFL